MAMYELAILGVPSAVQVSELTAELDRHLAHFSLKLGEDVSLSVAPARFRPAQQHAAAAIFVGGVAVSDAGLADLLAQGVPVIPVVSRPGRFSAEIPEILRRFNGLIYPSGDCERIITALLECAGLLPRQRRVFVSYRRQDCREAALQLFDAFSARLFDVFLDTHGIPPGEDFQALLWHRLCESDVLVMIDTPGYFDGRWTAAEFGRALAKGISVLRIGWPGSQRTRRAETAWSIELAMEDVDEGSGRIAQPVIEHICNELEVRRSESIAIRHLNLIGTLKQSLASIGGAVEGVGMHKGIHIRLPDGTPLVAYAATGSPTSLSLQEAAAHSPSSPPAVVYDHVGLHADHLGHLDWLGGYIPAVRLVKTCEAAWRFAAWDT